VCGDDGGVSISRAPELAIKSLEKSISLEPRLGWAYYHMALAHEYMGKSDKARETCKTAISKIEKSEAKSHLENYLKLLESPRPDKETAEQLKKESFEHLKQALLYQKSRNRKMAIKEFEQGCGKAPDSYWLYTNLCQLGSKKGTRH
jgi:tetratricopeptide (TPR) repeat protein